MIYPIILAGGTGTRMWPLSRTDLPKQFVPLEPLGGHSLFQKSLIRAQHIQPDVSCIRVLIAKEHISHVHIQALSLGIHLSDDQILFQPAVRNTLPAISLCILSLPTDDSIACILPSDHLIADDVHFSQVIRSGVPSTRDDIVVFGISPTEANTGYGYIAPSDMNESICSVEKFHEKPDIEKAKQYISEGYMWNAGIFLCQKSVYVREMKKYAPDILKMLTQNTNESYMSCPDISIDVGLMEKSTCRTVVRADIAWNDLGSFDAMNESLYKETPNVNLFQVGGKNNTIIGESKRIISLVDVDDIIIVDTPDVLMISRKGSTQDVKKAYEQVKNIYPNAIQSGVVGYRPWGTYYVLEDSDTYKIKKLIIQPGKRLSLQSHVHRSEHWTVVAGTATVDIRHPDHADIQQIRILRENEGCYIPAGHLHRLANTSSDILIIVEVQCGGYTGEDDIQRYDDDFGRV